jgi:hypothetical protein
VLKRLVDHFFDILIFSQNFARQNGRVILPVQFFASLNGNVNFLPTQSLNLIPAGSANFSD